jgi:hypothetical protein
MKKQKKPIKKPLTHHVAHHAKRIYAITPRFIHGMVVGAIVGVLVVVGLRSTVASALTISSPRDCDTNSVINCGALTTTELQQRYSYKGVSAIYNYFGISAAEVKAMGTTAVAGRVYKDGKVTIGASSVVATGAITAGRENISGSTKVTSGGVTFYKRAPSVSFHPSYISAFVVMKNGVFQFAILGACGNPVNATPIPKDTPPPKAPPVPETPNTPVPPSTQTPPSTPLPPTVTPTPEVLTASSTNEVASLPNTGPGAVAIIALLAVIGGYVFHRTHKHVKRKIHAAKHGPHAASRS